MFELTMKDREVVILAKIKEIDLSELPAKDKTRMKKYLRKKIKNNVLP